MRLKFELNQLHISSLLNVISKGSQAAGSDEVVLKFGEPGDILAVGFVSSPEEAEVWAKLKSADVFANFICESARNNCIELTGSSKNLVSALRFAVKMKRTIVKLSRARDSRGIGEPLLVFEYRYNLLESETTFTVLQSVPVWVSRDLTDIKIEPQLDAPSMKLETSSGLARIRHIVERCTSLKLPSMRLKGKFPDVFEISGVSDDAEVTASLSGLVVESLRTNSECITYVDSSKFQRIVNSFASLITASSPTFMLSPEIYLCIWVSLEDHIGIMTAVMPALLLVS
jgi:hypothetical protein